MYKPRYRKKKASKTRIAAAIVAAGATSALPVTQASAATTGQWDSVAACEASGDWSINYSSDGQSVGGLQFQNPSWHDALDYLSSHGYDVSGFRRNLYQGMPRSEVPSKDQQILAGEALLHIQGSGAWVTVSDGCASLGESMFDGGRNPWGLPGTEWPGSGHSSGGGSTPPPPVTSGGGSHVSPGEGEDGDSDNPLGGGSSSAPSANTSPSVSTGHSSRSGTTYSVVSGDWLIKIAERHYGDWTKWVDIYNANKAVIGSNPDLIYPGQVLVLP